MNDIITPLSREEMATYVTYMDQNSQIIAEMVKKYCDTQTLAFNTAITKLAEVFDDRFLQISEALTNIANGQEAQVKAISSAAEMARKQNFALANKSNVINKTEIKRNPLFHSTMNNEQQTLWIEKVCGEIAKICLEDGKNKGSVYRDIYAGLKQQYTYDVPELLKEYKQINTKADALTMIAASDAIRNACENIINKRFHNKVVKKLKSKATTFEKSNISNTKKFTYDEVHKCPDSVTNIIKRINNNAKGRTYEKAYKLLDIDRDKLVKDTAKKLGVSHVSIGYAIGTNPMLLTKLDAAVTKYLQKKGGEK